MDAVVAKTALLFAVAKRGYETETVRQRLIWVRVLLLETIRARIVIIAWRKSPGVRALIGATQHEAVEGARTFEAHIVSW